jgi:hypothetical protein
MPIIMPPDFRLTKTSIGSVKSGLRVSLESDMILKIPFLAL